VRGRVEVFGGVPVLGRIAAADVAAGEAEAEVDPPIAAFDTVRTSLFIRMRDLDLIEMPADIGHARSVADFGGK